MRSLAQEDNIRDLRKNLQALPEGIDASYEAIVQRIHKQDHRMVARAEEIIALISCAFRPLSQQEVLCALTVRPGDTFFDAEGTPSMTYLLSACCGLVILEGKEKFLRFIHQSAAEYFRQRACYQGPEAHEKIVGILLTYLSSMVCKDQNCDSRLTTFSTRYHKEYVGGDTAYALCTYAVDMWSMHARAALGRERTNDDGKTSQIQEERTNSGWDVNNSLSDLKRDGVHLPFAGRYPYHCLVCGNHPNKIHFVGKCTVATSHPNRRQSLENLIRRNVSEREMLRSGCLYISKPHGDIGHIMIGSTTRSVQSRLIAWARHCSHEMHLEYPTPHQLHRIRPLGRLEALVRADLGGFRRTELRCAGCGLQHFNWFETTVPEAIRTVEKWVEWLRKEPYEKQSGGEQSGEEQSGGVWVLKDEHLRDLPDLLQQAPVSEPLSPPLQLSLKSLKTSFSSPGPKKLGGHTLLLAESLGESPDPHVYAVEG